MIEIIKKIESLLGKEVNSLVPDAKNIRYLSCALERLENINEKRMIQKHVTR